MKIQFIRSTFFWVVAVLGFLAGCSLLQGPIVAIPPSLPAVSDERDVGGQLLDDLPAPTPYVPFEINQQGDKQIRGTMTKELFANIRITKDNDVQETTRQLQEAVLECQHFLFQYFGPPKYLGVVNIHFTTNPKDNGKMIWKKSTPASRRVRLNDMTLYRDNQSTLWDIIVHEMFHALYQPNELIARSSDFVLEAQATYAQYLAKDYFFNQGISNKRVYLGILQKVEAIQCGSEDPLDLNSPFERYGQCSIDKLYLLGALLFAHSDNGRKAVAKTLNPSTSVADVRQWMLENNIDVPPLMRSMFDVYPPLQNVVKNSAQVRPEATLQEIQQIKEMQLILKKLNLYSGQVDGVLKQKTRKAILLFQKKHVDTLQPTANLDAETLKLLEQEGCQLGFL